MAESIQYTNRKDKTYYLHAVTTKAGKTCYVMTRIAEDALTELPEGYVITENVEGQVLYYPIPLQSVVHLVSKPSYTSPFLYGFHKNLNVSFATNAATNDCLNLRPHHLSYSFMG